MSDAADKQALLSGLRDIELPPLGMAAQIADLLLAFGIGLLLASCCIALLRLRPMARRRRFVSPAERLARCRDLPPSERAAALAALVRETGAEVPTDIREALYRPESSIAALERLDAFMATTLKRTG